MRLNDRYSAAGSRTTAGGGGGGGGGAPQPASARRTSRLPPFIGSSAERARNQAEIGVVQVAVQRFPVDALGDLGRMDDLLGQDLVDHRLPLLPVEFRVGGEDRG